MTPESRLEWEHGVLQIPGAAYSGLRADIMEAQQRQYRLVLEAIGRFWEDNRSIKDPGRLHEAMKRHAQCIRNPLHHYTPALDTIAKDFEDIWNSSIFLWESGASRTPKPTKEFLASHQYVPATSATNEFRTGFSSNGTVTFIRPTRTIVWEVIEGDKACEWERHSLIGSVLFRSLARINWTNGSGGLILGNDEHSHHRRKYIKTAFGPAGMREAEKSYFPFR